MGAFDIHQRTLTDYLSWLTTYSNEEYDTVDVPKFTWKGSEYSCNAKWIKQRDLTAGGFLPMDDLVLEVLQSMATIPETEDLVTYNDHQFRIRIVEVATGKNPKLVCYDPARGA